MTDRYLIVGLGNPGREFDNTRHNIGFRAVDSIAAAHGLVFTKRQSKALVADGVIAEKKVLIAKPQTYMNLSGESVRGFVDFFKIPLEHIMVISDDLDIPPGTLRIRAKGGTGGQGGLKSITAHLGSSDFPRMRIGIGRPPGRMLARDYVLQNFAPEENILVIETLNRVDKAIETWIRLGIELMMTRHNGTADESARNANAGTPKPEPAPQPPPTKRD